MSKYIGITIGPIFDTMNLSSKPAGLWCASYLFSYMNKQLCEAIQRVYGEKMSIIVPIHKCDEMYDAGVGMYHDRIIIKVLEEQPASDIIADLEEKVIAPVKRQIAENICMLLDDVDEQAKEELYAYFQVYSVCMDIDESQGIMKEISNRLDVLELQKQFQATNRTNYMLEFLKDNEKIKNCFLTPKNKSLWQLLKKDGSIKTIDSLCKAECPYYAIVQADGDYMGAVLTGLKSAEDVKAFSEKCMQYATMAAKEIAAFGGITIYAGGDDLMFLAPLENAKGNIMELITTLREKFETAFDEEKYSGCRVSFGIEIVYKSFPLYEALDMARNQLFGTAKSKRNTCAIGIQKHSGQSAAFAIHDFSEEAGRAIAEKISKLISRKKEDFLNSVSKHIGDNKGLFSLANTRPQISNLFQNVFDNEMQRKYAGDIQLIEELFVMTQTAVSYSEDSKFAILAVLRMAQLYVKEKEYGNKNITN